MDNENLMYCSDCGNQMSKRAASCPKCGSPNRNAQSAAVPTQIINIQNNASQQSSQAGYAVQQKSRLVYIILAVFLGLLGVHNFYAGYTGTGLIQLLLTCTGIGAIVVAVWLILDILCTSKDGHGIPFIW